RNPPGDIALQTKPSESGVRRCPADGSQVTEVSIHKRLIWLSIEGTADIASRVAPHLDGDLGNSGQRFSIRPLERCEIADDKYFGVTRDCEVGLDDHTAGAVGRNSERGANRRRRDTRCPQDSRGINRLTIHLHASLA